jgi:uncharacterized protein (TIGR02118 family)
MIKVSVFYPNNDGARFDMDYYRDRHMPMVQERLGAACKGIAVERGVAGGTPGSRPQFIAMGHIYFDSLEEFQSSFGQHAKEFVADVPNYTNLQPVIQISEVVVALEPVAAREHA